MKVKGIYRRIDDAGSIIIPKKFRSLFGLKEGELLEIVPTDEGVLIKPFEKMYNTHEVAGIIIELLGDTCACNFNGNDEWLPKYCEFAERECPNTVGITCWEQYLKNLDKKWRENNA